MKQTRDGYEFDSWPELMRVATDAPNLAPELGERTSRRIDESGDWAGTKTFEDGVKLAREGWPEGADRIAALRDTLYLHLAEIVQRTEVGHARQGPGHLNLKRYSTGNPAPYRVRRETDEQIEIERQRGVLRLAFNMAASACIDTEVMFRRGAAIAALVDCLERARFRVELDIGAACHVGSERVDVHCRVKNAGDHLEPDLLAFVCAHASAFRRIMFSVWETLPAAKRAACWITEAGNYGYPCASFTRRDCDIVIEAADGRDERWESTESAAQWVRAMLQAQGVALADEDEAS